MTFLLPPSSAFMVPPFVEELRKTVGPIATRNQTALAYLGPGGADWLTVSGDCPCSACPDKAEACMQCQAVSGRVHHTIDVSFESKPAGKVFFCSDTAAHPLATALGELTQSLIRQTELEKEKESLLEELSASWESLEAVYDVSSNLRTVDSTEGMLDRILDRAIAIQDDLRAIVWLLDAEELRPVATKNIEAPPPRLAQSGLIGKTLTSLKGTVVNGRDHLAVVADLEPELRNAGSVAVVPILTRQDVLGVLELWHENGSVHFDSRTLHLLETLTLLAAMVVENDRLHRAHLASERLRQEVEIGSRIQQILLLGRPSLETLLIRAAALTLPSLQIDGDFYDFFEQDHSLDVLVGDVMGKGIPAALVGAATKHHFLRAMNRLLALNSAHLPEPRDILTMVNQNLVKQLVGIESFVTLCFARFDMSRQHLEMVDCGHTRTIHYQSRQGTCALVQGDNMPLGFSEGELYEQVSVPFQPGDVFVFYSDGVTEAANPEGEQYGEQRLVEVVLRHPAQEPKELVETIRKEVMAFSKSETFRDDLTCVAVKILDGKAAAPKGEAMAGVIIERLEPAPVRPNTSK